MPSKQWQRGKRAFDTDWNKSTHTHARCSNQLFEKKIHGKQGVKLNGCPSGLYLSSSSVLLSILTLFSFYFWRSSQIWVFFAMIDWVLAFVFFNMSSPAHFTIPAVHSLTLFACVCSRRWASVNTVTQKEATQRRHAKFTQLLTQNDEVRHWFQDAPSSLQKERQDGWCWDGGSRRSGEGERKCGGREREREGRAGLSGRGVWAVILSAVNDRAEIFLSWKQLWKAVWKILLL